MNYYRCALCAVFMWVGMSVLALEAKEVERDISGSRYITPALDKDVDYKFDLDGRPLRGRLDKKKASKKKDKKEQKNKMRNKWAKKPGKRRPQDARPVRAPRQESVSSKDASDTAPAQEQGKGKGFDYGNVKVDSNKKVGVLEDPEESVGKAKVNFGGAPPQDSDDPPQDSDDPPQDSDDPPQDSGDPPQDSDDPPQDSGDPPEDSGDPSQGD